MLDLSVVIITLNEEHRLASCLESLPANVEIIVLDSFSGDKTQAIAKSFGAKVLTRKFDNYAAQKNAAITFATRNWILSLDADEILSPKLREHIEQICSQKDGAGSTGYKLQRRLFFLNRLLRYGKATDYPIRLFKKNSASFQGSVHEKLVFPGNPSLKTICATGCFIEHHSYENLSDYFDKFNRYTSAMAEKSSDKSPRGQSLQLLRPWFEFFRRYFLNLGFLDGYEGYCYAYISSAYKFVKYAKLRELHAKAKNA